MTRPAPAFLIQAPLWGFVPPLSLAQLSGELKARGGEATPIDLNIELYRLRGDGHKFSWSWEQNTLWLDEKTVAGILDEPEAAAYIKRRCVDAVPEGVRCLVGFSVNECSIIASMHIARLIKAARPQAFVVFGGQAFAEPDRIERCLRQGVVDAVCTQDGEDTLVEVVERLGAGRGVEDCAGLHIMRDGKVRQTGDRPPVDLNRIAFCDFESLDLKRYEVPDNLYSKSLMIMASRGCVRHCQFCGSRKPWEGYRYMSGRRVYDEIKHQLARHPQLTELKFYDIVTNGNMKRVMDLCDLLIADKSVNLTWEECNCIVRPEMTYEAMCKMREAGCHRVTYGIESGSDHVLGLMQKGQTAALAERVLLDTHRAGLVATANFMFGYPGETEEDFEETLEFVKRVHSFVNLFYPSRTLITMEPLSDMAGRRKELGIDDGTDVFWETLDGKNTYPIRLERYERFSRLLTQLGARESQGVNSSLELHRWYSLGEYYEYKGALDKAGDCYRSYLKLDPGSAVIQSKLERCLKAAA